MFHLNSGQMEEYTKFLGDSSCTSLCTLVSIYPTNCQNSVQGQLKAHLQPRGIAHRGTIFIYENSTIFENQPIRLQRWTMWAFRNKKQTVAKHTGWWWAFKGNNL